MKTILKVENLHIKNNDVEILKRLGNHRLDVTIGSALDIFGGTIPFEKAADIS